MGYRVRVRQIEETFTADIGQTILDAAFAAGHDFPCGCQSGNCGACKSYLLSGEVEMSPYSDYALTADEKAAGQILACRAVPWSDVEIAWLETDDVAAHPQRQMQCRVQEVSNLTHDIKQVRLQIISGGPFDFSPGQYARIGFTNIGARDFSMANQPSAPYLEFHIRAVDGGIISQHIFNQLKPGDMVSVEGPRGIAFLREKHTGPILALAGGSGLAPIKSIIERALLLGARQPIRLYFGVRDERDLYLEKHFQALATHHPNFKFIPVLSAASGPTDRRTGFLADVLKDDIATVDGMKVYLAGPPAMVESCLSVLQNLNLPKQHCHADAFYTEADRAKGAAA